MLCSFPYLIARSRYDRPVGHLARGGREPICGSRSTPTGYREREVSLRRSLVLRERSLARARSESDETLRLRSPLRCYLGCKPSLRCLRLAGKGCRANKAKGWNLARVSEERRDSTSVE